jgi:hypothetical protein
MKPHGELDQLDAEVPFRAMIGRTAYALTALWLLYSFLGQALLTLYRALFSSGREATGAVLHTPPGGIAVTLVGGDGAAVGASAAQGALSMYLVLLATCAVAAMIFVNFVTSVCEQEWVKEKVKVKRCWKTVKWYNPWSWVKALFCIFYEVLKEIMREVCKIFPKSVLFWTLVCYVAAIAALA